MFNLFKHESKGLQLGNVTVYKTRFVDRHPILTYTGLGLLIVLGLALV